MRARCNDLFLEGLIDSVGLRNRSSNCKTSTTAKQERFLVLDCNLKEDFLHQKAGLLYEDAGNCWTTLPLCPVACGIRDYHMLG